MKDNQIIIENIRCRAVSNILIYLFYSPRLQFDVLENPNKSTNTSRSDQSAHQNNQKDDGNPKPKEGIGTWIGKDISYLTKSLDRQIGHIDIVIIIKLCF